MFSLDVVRWRKRRSEMQAARVKYAQKATAPLSQAEKDRQAKQLYGKTSKEMYESYLDRVSSWIKEAPAEDWGKDYAKEDYPKNYVPRVRHKDLEHAGPVKNGCYSPRAIYKGGGQCVRRLGPPEDSSELQEQPREVYAERIINFVKTREKHKEIHPPMAFLKNKPLTCAKYFVEDIICADNNDTSEDDKRFCDARTGEVRAGSRRCSARCPPSPERRDDDVSEETNTDSEDRRRRSSVHDRLYLNAHSLRPTVLGGTATPEPPTTAEYVAHPQWREHSPQKWVGGKFTSTILSSNTHTASRRSISGSAYTATLLINEPYASAGVISSPASPQVRAFEHERRVKMAASSTFKPLQRPQKKYFNSMWTEPPAGVAAGGGDKPSIGGGDTCSIAPSDASNGCRASSSVSVPQLSPLTSPQLHGNGGRELLLSIRKHHSREQHQQHQQQESSAARKP